VKFKLGGKKEIERGGCRSIDRPPFSPRLSGDNKFLNEIRSQKDLNNLKDLKSIIEKKKSKLDRNS
jgi:hypothetical protein